MTTDTEGLLWRRFNEWFRARRPDYPSEWAAYQAGHAAAKAETAAAGISDAAVQALESIAAMTFDRWSEGYRAGQIAIAALDKLRVQTTEWGPAPVGNEADEPMSLADRLDLMADAQAAGGTAQSDLYAAATVWRKHLRGQPAPTQADSAPGDEAQRELIDKEAERAAMALERDNAQRQHTMQCAINKADSQRILELTAQLAEAQRDSERLDWLAKTDNAIGQVLLPRWCVEQNLHSMRAAIDAAMKDKP